MVLTKKVAAETSVSPLPFAKLAPLVGVNIQQALGDVPGGACVVSACLTLVLECLVSTYIFQCPCLKNNEEILTTEGATVPRWRAFYSLCFFGWPAVILIMLVVTLDKRIHRLLLARRRCACRPCSWTSLASLMTPPVTWVVFALLHGGYVECGMAVVPDVCLPLYHNATDTFVLSMRTTNYRLRAISQCAGLGLLGCGLVLVASGYLISQLCSRHPYYLQKWIGFRQRQEEVLFDKVSQDILSKQYEAKWKVFLGKPDISTGQWEEPITFDNMAAPLPRIPEKERKSAEALATAETKT